MIKNIIFDFGDVFINLDKTATARHMRRFGFTEIIPELDLLFKNYEKGLISSEDFLGNVGKRFPSASKTDLIHAWNAILLDFPDFRLKFLEELAAQKQYRLFLLSNTNEIHIEHERNKLGEKFDRFENAFEGFYLSHEINMRKPDLEIFEFVLQTNDLIPEQTLFIDDTKENTDAAAHLGIVTWNLLVGTEDVTELKSRL